MLNEMSNVGCRDVERVGIRGGSFSLFAALGFTLFRLEIRAVPDDALYL
jgi:hypothetical protein